MHHAIIDGWSNALLLNKIFDNLLNNGVKENKKLTSKPFYEYCLTEEAMASKNIYLQFWRNQLKDYVHFPYAKLDNKNTLEGGSSQINLSQDLIHKIELFSLNKNISVKTFFLYHFMKMLSDLSGCKDVCTGMVTNTRHSDIEDSLESVGMYWNFAPIRLNFNDNYDGYKQLHSVIMQIDGEYGVYPLSSILKGMKLKSLFSSTFKYINFHHKNKPNKNISVYKSIDLYAYPINFTVANNGFDNGGLLRIDYMKNYFCNKEIDEMLKKYFVRIQNLF